MDQQFPYDGTVDDYSKYNGEDDKDSPVELFGAGFRNGYDSLSWNETSPLSDRNDNGNHHVYSLGFDNGKAIDVDYYSFSNPHNAKPFAIGKVDGLEQGDMVPEDSVFEFNVDVGDKNIHHFVADSLSKGKIFFALSQILYGRTAEGGKGYPDFYTSDHILGEGPTLKIEFEIVPAKLEPPVMSIKRNGAGGVVLEWGIANETDAYMFKIYGGILSIVRRSTVKLDDSVLLRNGLDPIETPPIQINGEVYNEVQPQIPSGDPFDVEDENGPLDGDDLPFVESPRARKYHTIEISRDNFNGDSLNGNGPSGYTIKPENVTMWKIEFGWYGAIGARFYAYIPLSLIHI